MSWVANRSHKMRIEDPPQRCDWVVVVHEDCSDPHTGEESNERLATDDREQNRKQWGKDGQKARQLSQIWLPAAGGLACAYPQLAIDKEDIAQRDHAFGEDRGGGDSLSSRRGVPLDALERSAATEIGHCGPLCVYRTDLQRERQVRDLVGPNALNLEVICWGAEQHGGRDQNLHGKAKIERIQATDNATEQRRASFALLWSWPMSRRQTVLILDFGSQYTQLIARRVREQSVYSEIHPYNIGMERIRAIKPAAIVLSGGPASCNDEDSPTISEEIFELDVPVLGICYGAQLVAKLLGGQVESSEKHEYGRAQLTPCTGQGLFAGFEPDESIEVWMSHGDRVQELPTGFELIGESTNSPAAAFANAKRGIYCVQFHPEVAHTPRGKEVIRNFLFGIANLKATWSMASFVDEAIHAVRKQVGDTGRIICGLSGGVDSSVVAALLHKAIGSRLTCIFVDNGLLRADERDNVERVFVDHFKVDLHVVDAADRFLDKLANETDPEKKRKIIGVEFIRVFEEEARSIENAKWLAQGTLYPDVIESVSFKGPSAVIKSHHNVGGLPDDMHLELVEPLRELFKDEVRELGRELGVPEEMVKRQPFPGPGLAVRCLGDLSRQRLETLRAADKILMEEICAASLYDMIWQCFGVLLPVKTVGVMGDQRTYAEVFAIRAVHSVDGMTADWVHLPYDVLGKVSSRVINEVRGINRVVYDVTSKPPGTIEWE